MKRVVLSLLGTVAGLVALLDFKSHGQAVHATGPLPSAGLPASSSSGPGSGTGRSGTSAPASPASSPSASGTQTVAGDAIETRYGIVQVQVTVSGGKIDNVKFLQLTAYDDRSAEINGQAAPILLQETLAAQSTQIDTVSGATFTSEGYLQSLQSALDRAGFR
jgi:uncharacterized protein with FMN-binding domain